MTVVHSVPIFAAYDLTEMGVLPRNWLRDITEAATNLARPAALYGGAPASLEPVGTVIRYGLINGESVSKALPWLDHLYRNEFLQLASRVAGERVSPSDNLINGVNINVLRGIGSRYELHLDTNPLTGLLFVTSHPPDDGGQLIFQTDLAPIQYSPRSGTLLLFDATKAPHEVSALEREVMRISVPMNYFIKNRLTDRPEELDAYLYGSK